jgi:transposase
VFQKVNYPTIIHFIEKQFILAFFAVLNSQTKVVIEFTASCYRLYDHLTDHGFYVVISDPVKTRSIASARVKNDKLDAHMLTQLLRADLLANIHVSSR